MNQDLLAQHYSDAPEAIRTFVTSRELDELIIEIAMNNNIAISNYTALKNAAILVLLNVTDRGQLARVLKKLLEISEEESEKISEEINTTVFNRARGIILQGDTEVRKIEVQADGTLAGTGDLRNTIIEASKSSAINNVPVETLTPHTKNIAIPGSRTELLEQLELVGQIPRDEDVAERLEKIHAQLESIKQKEAEQEASYSDNSQTEGTQNKPKPYFPKEYAIDPYRELS